MKLYISEATLRTIEKFGNASLTHISATPSDHMTVELDVYRAALTAEKVAAEPVAWMIRIGDSNVWSYTQLESDADFYGKQSGMKYEKRPLYAAPQQPAQSAEQDERAAFLSGRDVEELFLRWSEWTTELGEAISRKNIDGFVSDLRALLAAQPVSGADHD
jgi:hypothetical protein